MRQSKGHAALVELMIVILFFALSSVTTLRLYALSAQTRARSERGTQALALAQDWAERLSVCGNADALLSGEGFAYIDGEYRLTQGELRLYVDKQTAAYASGVLTSMTLSVYHQQELLCALPVSVFTQKGARP